MHATAGRARVRPGPNHNRRAEPGPARRFSACSPARPGPDSFSSHTARPGPNSSRTPVEQLVGKRRHKLKIAFDRNRADGKFEHTCKRRDCGTSVKYQKSVTENVSFALHFRYLAKNQPVAPPWCITDALLEVGLPNCTDYQVPNYSEMALTIDLQLFTTLIYTIKWSSIVSICVRKLEFPPNLQTPSNNHSIVRSHDLHWKYSCFALYHHTPSHDPHWNLQKIILVIIVSCLACKNLSRSNMLYTIVSIFCSIYNDVSFEIFVETCAPPVYQLLVRFRHKNALILTNVQL